MAKTLATANRLAAKARQNIAVTRDQLRGVASGLSQKEENALASAVAVVQAANEAARSLKNEEEVLKAYGLDQVQDGIGAIAHLLAAGLQAEGELDVFNYDPKLIELRQTSSARRAQVPLNAILHSFGLAVAQGVVDVVSRSYTPNATGQADVINVFPTSQDASGDSYVSFGAPPDVSYTSYTATTPKVDSVSSTDVLVPSYDDLDAVTVARADNGSTKRCPAIIPAVLLETSVQQNTGVLSSITAELEGVFSNETNIACSMLGMSGDGFSANIPQAIVPGYSGFFDTDSSGAAGKMNPVHLADGFKSGKFVYSARTYVDKCPMAIFPYQKREGKTYIRPLAIQPEVYAEQRGSNSPSKSAVVYQKGIGVRLNIFDAAVGTNIELQLITAIHEMFPVMYDLALSALLQGGRIVRP